MSSPYFRLSFLYKRKMSKTNETFTDHWPRTLNPKILKFLKRKNFIKMTPVQVVKSFQRDLLYFILQ